MLRSTVRKYSGSSLGLREAGRELSQHFDTSWEKKGEEEEEERPSSFFHISCLSLVGRGLACLAVVFLSLSLSFSDTKWFLDMQIQSKRTSIKWGRFVNELGWSWLRIFALGVP